MSLGFQRPEVRARTMMLLGKWVFFMPIQFVKNPLATVLGYSKNSKLVQQWRFHPWTESNAEFYRGSSCFIQQHFSSLEAFIPSVSIFPFNGLRTVSFRSSLISNCMVELLSLCSLASFLMFLGGFILIFSLPGNLSSRVLTVRGLPLRCWSLRFCLLKLFEELIHLKTMPFEHLRFSE